MHAQALADDLGDRHARAERAVGILEHDLHLAPQRPHGAELEALQRLADEHDRAFAEIRRNSARPSVVLPDPDSPTTPSVSPRRMASRNAVDRLDVADGPPQQAALDREPDAQVVASTP